MADQKYNRNITELSQQATMWWPTFLSELESSTSVIPLLLQSQHKFISLLILANAGPNHIIQLISAAKFPANLFLKHLVVLTDFGGEKIQRLNSQIDKVFPINAAGKRTLEYIVDSQTFTYDLKALPIKGTLNNLKLNIDGTSLSKSCNIDNLKQDMLIILLYGANSTNPYVAEVLNKCMVGNLIGKKDEIDEFVKQRYLFVSRITGGAEANTLGQVAQTYVCDYLRRYLREGYTIQSNGHIDGITHNDGKTLTNFDVVVSRDNKHVAIEISFQVTTNSTIERKAGQAKARYDMVSASNNFISYIIDGAGNFQRRSAISTICENSHCTVAYTDSELQTLISFIKMNLEQ